MLRGWEILRSANRVYRGRNTLLSGVACLIIVNMLAMGTIIQAADSPPLVLFAVAYGVVGTIICFRLMWSGVFVMQNGIHVANIFSSYDVPWDDIERLDIGRWKINRQTCLVHTRDGKIRPANGLQESTNFPNGSAKTMVKELDQERSVQSMGSKSPSPAQHSSGLGRT